TPVGQEEEVVRFPRLSPQIGPQRLRRVLADVQGSPLVPLANDGTATAGQIEIPEAEGAQLAGPGAGVQEKQHDRLVAPWMPGPPRCREQRGDLLIGKRLDLVGAGDGRAERLHRALLHRPFSDQVAKEGPEVSEVGGGGARAYALPQPAVAP